MSFPRASGILLHPASLPSRGGIGDFGPAAYEFVDFLSSARQGLWQVLPLGPPANGNSPYSSTSAFAGKTIESSRIRRERGVIVPAIKRREAMHFNPAPDERIEPDDCLMAMGEPAQLRQLELTATSKS